MHEDSLLNCPVSNNSLKWDLLDLFIWEILPKKLGGGFDYIQNYKNAWVIHNKDTIKQAARRYRLPVELLVGVCWIEVGGDPDFIDRIAFEVRTIDWIGPDYVDKHFTVTNPAKKTSFGFVSMQLETAAKTLGLDVKNMDSSTIRALAHCLEKDVYNINLVAEHLRQLADYDKLPITLNMEDIKIIGARYNRGTNPTLDEIKINTSYGDFIVRNWQRFSNLIRQ